MVRDGLRPISAILLLLILGPMTGCKYEQLTRQNESLWSQNQELQQELERQRLALDSLEEDLNSARSTGRELDGPVNVFTAGAAANTGTGFGEIQGVEAVQGPDRVTVRIPGDVLFAAGRAKLRRSVMKTLDQIAEVIEQQYANHTVMIKGYTDTDPIKKSKWSDNLELSLQRAAAVHRYLQKHGVDPARMQAVGHGPWHPRQTKADSRRVEIVVALDE